MLNKQDNLSPDEEKALIESAKHDKDSFGRLYELYFSRIYDYIFRRTGNRDLTEDLTSQVFMQVLENISKFEWRGLPFSAWLYRIAANSIVTHFRKNKHIASTDLDDVDFLITSDENNALEDLIENETLAEDKKKYAALRKALFEMEDKYSELITLKFFEKKSNKEISQILKISEGNLRIRLFRALKVLKDLLNQLSEDEK